MAELLAHYIGSQPGGAENRVQAGIDRYALIDPIPTIGVSVPLFQFCERELIRPIAVNLVRASEQKGEPRQKSRAACRTAD